MQTTINDISYRNTVIEDIYNIIPNEYFNISKEFIIQGLKNIPTIRAWTVFSNKKIIAIILANEFYKDFYAIGLILCEGIKISELKALKKIAKEIVDTYGMKYVYSEGESHPVKDRFHKFMDFELENTILGKFKKWRYKLCHQ